VVFLVYCAWHADAIANTHNQAQSRGRASGCVTSRVTSPSGGITRAAISALLAAPVTLTALL
jgi:hypothetical protein